MSIVLKGRCDPICQSLFINNRNAHCLHGILCYNIYDHNIVCYNSFLISLQLHNESSAIIGIQNKNVFVFIFVLFLDYFWNYVFLQL
jgi:hypothetical protein